MRIVGGLCKGLPLEAPAGRQTRPTIDRVRESMASMVLSACEVPLEEACILDAFAGSGALGLELVSRGAPVAVFCETHGQTRRILQKNVKKVSEQTHAQCKVLSGSVYISAEQGFSALTSSLSSCTPFDIVMLDPPYATELHDVISLIKNLDAHELLSENALIVYERLHTSEPLQISGYETIKSKKYGTVGVDLLRKVCK